MRKFIAAIVIFLSLLATPAYAIRDSGQHGESAFVTKTEFNSVTYGQPKYQVENIFGQTGHRTLSWNDGTVDWIQKSYVGKRIPDEFQGTETKAIINYSWDGTHWRLGYKTWCVWNNLNAWNCS